MRTFSESGTCGTSVFEKQAKAMSRLQATVYKGFSLKKTLVAAYQCPAHFARLHRDMSRAFCTSRLQAFIYKACKKAMSHHVPANVPQTLKRDIASPYL